MPVWDNGDCEGFGIVRDNWQNDFRALDVELHDIPGAFGLLTILPIPMDHARAADRAAASAWAFPLVGACIGLIAGLAGMVLSLLGIPSEMAAGVALGLMIFLTGGLHEDGLADCADGFGGGQTVARRLEIMKDSRLGSFGVLALIVVCVMRWAGIDGLLTAQGVGYFIAIGAISRLPLALAMWAMPLARTDGLAASVGMVGPAAAAVGFGIALCLSVLFAGWAGILMLFAACIAAVAVCIIAWRRIEGYTGDVLGAVQQIAEVAALMIAVAML